MPQKDKVLIIPSTNKQIRAQEILHQYKKDVIGDALKGTVEKIDPKELHSEIVEYVPEDCMKILQSSGIRDENFFALPCILKKNPKMLGYYRLLMGISEKQFYSSATGLSQFNCMEEKGVIPNCKNTSCIQELCKAINGAMQEFLKELKKDCLSQDVSDFPIMTLGVYVDGVWRNFIGANAANNVFNAIKNIVNEKKLKISENNEKVCTFTNKKGKKFSINLASDPDVSIYANESKLLCIEIKGGQDVANVHNRAGEAEKSHQKAKKSGWKHKWTVIYLSKLQTSQQSKLRVESPTTDEWFDVNEICCESGTSYNSFKEKILKIFEL